MSKANDAEKIRTLSKIDLNLLTIFCLIYSVGSITRVADMLNISPSAVSQSLKKLRELMGDNLLSAAAMRYYQPSIPTSFTTMQSRLLINCRC